MISDDDLGEIIENNEEYEPSNFFEVRYSNGYILKYHIGKCKKLYKIDPISNTETLVEIEGENILIPLPEEK